VHAPYEDTTDDVKDSFDEELGCVMDQIPRYDMKNLLGDLNANVGRENVFKLTNGNDSLHEIRNDTRVTAVNFATSKNIAVTCTMFPHCNIHKYTWNFPEGKMHNQTDHILTDRRQRSGILHVRSFRGADRDTDHYLALAKVRERLAVSKQAAQKIEMEIFNLKKINEGRGGC
jgi:hypothetical protein